jgi:excisionase family DNA binding protein
MSKVPLSIGQVVERSGIPKRTIHNAVARGELKSMKLPGLTGAYLIDEDDLDRWLAGRQQETASQ